MNILKKVEDYTLILFFSLGVSVNLFGVFLRYFTDVSQHWTTEGYTLLLQAAIFIGFATALRDDEHISIDVLYDRFSKKWRKIVSAFSYLVGIAFSIFFTYSGMQITIKSYEQGMTTPDIGLLVWITYAIMPVTGILLLIHFIAKIIKLFSDGDEWEGEA